MGGIHSKRFHAHYMRKPPVCQGDWGGFQPFGTRKPRKGAKSAQGPWPLAIVHGCWVADYPGPPRPAGLGKAGLGGSAVRRPMGNTMAQRQRQNTMFLSCLSRPFVVFVLQTALVTRAHLQTPMHSPPEPVDRRARSVVQCNRFQGDEPPRGRPHLRGELCHEQTQ